MVRCQNVQGKHGIFLSSFFYFLAINNKILRRSQHFVIIQSDQDLCPLTNLMGTMKYINGQEQSREDPDQTVRMHRYT